MPVDAAPGAYRPRW